MRDLVTMQAMRSKAGDQLQRNYVELLFTNIDDLRCLQGKDPDGFVTVVFVRAGKGEAAITGEKSWGPAAVLRTSCPSREIMLVFSNFGGADGRF